MLWGLNTLPSSFPFYSLQGSEGMWVVAAEAPIHPDQAKVRWAGFGTSVFPLHCLMFLEACSRASLLPLPSRLGNQGLWLGGAERQALNVPSPSFVLRQEVERCIECWSV